MVDGGWWVEIVGGLNNEFWRRRAGRGTIFNVGCAEV